MTGNYMKRKFPLFCFDLERTHKLGECDFVVCTDIDSGFVAKIDFIECDTDYVDDTTRIITTNGIGARMSIERVFGNNPDKGSIRTLMKKGMELYMRDTQHTVNTDNPSYVDCINFLDVLIKGNRHNIDSCGSDVNERKIVITSIIMLESIKRKLIDHEQDRDRTKN